MVVKTLFCSGGSKQKRLRKLYESWCEKRVSEVCEISPQAGRQNEKHANKLISYDDVGKNTGHKNIHEFYHDANLTSNQQTNGKQLKRTKRQKLRCGPAFSVLACVFVCWGCPCGVVRCTNGTRSGRFPSGVFGCRLRLQGASGVGC